MVGKRGASRSPSHTTKGEPKGNIDSLVKSHLAGLRGRLAGNEVLGLVEESRQVKI